MTFLTYDELEEMAAVNLLEIGHYIVKFQGRKAVTDEDLKEDITTIFTAMWETLEQHATEYDIHSAFCNLAKKESCDFVSEVYDAEQDETKEVRFFFIGDHVTHEDFTEEEEEEEEEEVYS